MGPEIKTVLLAMTPINELRGTIPLAISVFQLSPLKTYILAVLGNVIPVFFLVWFWKHLSGFLMKKNKGVNRFFLWLFKRTHKRFYNKYTFYGDLVLILLVAIPLPFTGAWTGTIAAFVFKVPYWRSIGLIFVGILIAGAIVTLGTMGIISII